MAATPIEEFSRDYVIAPTVDIHKHGGDEAILDEEVYSEFATMLGEPIVGHIGSLHYQFKPSRSVMAGRGAVPSRHHKAASEPLPLLLLK